MTNTNKTTFTSSFERFEMTFEKNKPLKELTTFGIGGPAKFFLRADGLDDLKQALEWAQEEGEKVFVLGGGSNILVSDKGFDGLVVSVNNKGINVLKHDEDEVLVKVASGEVWDKVVAKSAENGWWGIENLSNIPGSTGAFAVQNVGAYGQEASQVVESVEVFDRESKDIKVIPVADCGFAYRESIFNRAEKSRHVILNTVLKLRINGQPNIGYPDVVKYFEEKNITEPSIQQIREAIVFIRDNKLPNPKEIGSAGSFFKNLVLTSDEYGLLEGKVGSNFDATIVGKLIEMKNKFPAGDKIKIPTAFLMDICGLKGKQIGGAMVYEKQPLILVNQSGKATARDVLGLAKFVKETIYNKTGMVINPEPEMVGFSEDELKDF